jgi:eukaryotic-like serine/threonine-protein kinase
VTYQNPFGGNPFDPAPAGHPPPGPPPVGMPPARHGEVNTLPTLSVVFAFVFAPAGAILGHLGLSQIARTRQRGRDRALVGVTLSYVFITAAVVALVVWAALGHNDNSQQITAAPLPPSSVAAAPTAPAVPATTTPPPPPTVAPAELAGLLPTVEYVKQISGNPNLTLAETDDHITTDSVTLDNQNCWGTILVASSHAYDVPAITGAATTDIRDQTNPRHNPYGTTQSVAAFRDASAAQQQLSKLTNSWRTCAGMTVVSTEADGRKTTYAVGDPTTEANGITTIEYRQTVPVTSGSPLRIVRMLAVKNNVVLDILAGSRQGGSSQHDIALAIVTFILDKIPGPR